MPYTRIWDKCCPRVWHDWWEDGARWLVQDLDPEDDELAVELLIEHFMTNETLLSSLGCHKDPASVRDARKFWMQTVSQRTSSGCYRCEGDKKELVGVNVCPVRCANDPPFNFKPWESEKWLRVTRIMVYAEGMHNLFNILNVDKYLSDVGLLVITQWRGRGLGKKLLGAREALCRTLGIKATANIFTAAESQREAEICWFESLSKLTICDIRQIGLDLPVASDYCLKFMFKKYDKIKDKN